MALKEWFERDAYFEIANQYLIKHKKSPAAATMREFCGGNGSLSTHQKLIEEWKAIQHVDLIELPEKVEKHIINKAKELFAEGWKALEEANVEENTKIKKEAHEKVYNMQHALGEMAAEYEEASAKLKTVTEAFEQSTTSNSALKNQIIESEKLRFAAEETKKELVNRFTELQERSQREKSELQTQYEMRENELKNQLSSNELKYQKEIERREEEKEAYKKEHECKTSAIEIVRDELYQKLNQAAADIKFYETKYQQALKDLEEKSGEVFQLRIQSRTFQDEVQDKKLQIERQIGHLQQAEKQISEYREKNLILEDILRAKSLRIGELEEKVANSLQVIQRSIVSAYPEEV